MAPANQRPRTRRVRLWVLIVLLVAVSTALVARKWRTRGRDYSDPALLRDLESASFAAEPVKPPELAPWPQWRGPNRDGVSTETGLLTEWPADGPKVLWKADAGLGYSTLAVAGGRVYTVLQDGDDEAVVCWDAATGKEAWRFRYPCRYENQFGNGPRSTPSVDGDRVYAVGATGTFHCLKADTGAKVWRHDLLDEFKAPNLRWGVSFSPLIEGNLVFTNPGGPGGNSLAAFDKHTGKLAWKGQDDAAGYSSPVVATLGGVRQVVFFTGNHLLGVRPADGAVLWRTEWETDYGCNIATPICRGDYFFISSGYGRGCALLKVTADGGKFTAQRVYEHTRMCNHFSTSVLVGEHIYGFHEAFLTCMDFRTGKVVWKERGFEKGSLLAADGHLIVLGEHGKLAVAPATPDGFREKASFQASDSKCWTVPVLAGRRLYVRDEKQVICFDVKE